jgi:hypothetical protein
MSAMSLHDRRTNADRRAVARTPQVVAPTIARRPTRRQIWTALLVYCTVFWSMVGYAIYDIFGR